MFTLLFIASIVCLVLNLAALSVEEYFDRRQLIKLDREKHLRRANNSAWMNAKYKTHRDNITVPHVTAK